MAIKLYSCPNTNCSKSIKVQTSHIGRKVKCTGCGTVMLLTNDGAVAVSSKKLETNNAESIASTIIQNQQQGGGRSSSGDDFTIENEQIGRFEIKEKLGAGGFGAVYRAYDTVLDREVALKVPHADRVANAMLQLGLCYDRDGRNEQALHWYQKAANAGNQRAKKRQSFLTQWKKDYPKQW